MKSKANDHASDQANQWMQKTLWFAAVYNLVWGAWVVLRPSDLFTLTGISPPQYIGIWQCVGMIVGVYGVGYAIAANNPFRHWPIVLVGLLGKVLGPIGFLLNMLTATSNHPGYLPWSWGLTILTNDLVWWIPFGAILYHVAKHSMAPTELYPAMLPSEANEQFVAKSGKTIAELSRQTPLLLLFLRHSGCTFCKEALSDLAKNYQQITSQGSAVAVVHQGNPEHIEQDLRKHRLDGVDRIDDPNCELYRAYHLRRGTFIELFGPDVLWRGFKAAILARYGVGKLDGDGFQMPGAFLVHHNRVLESYRHQSASDRPDLCQLAARGAP